MLLSTTGIHAQDKQVKPTILYGQTRRLEIGNISVFGAEGYEDNLIIGLSGLTIGQAISVPGDEITEAVKRYWKHGLFSDARIEADSIVDGKIYLSIHVAMRPRVSEININGVKKSEKDDLTEKIGILKGNQITPNMVNKAKTIAKKYFDEKGFKNAEIEIVQRDDPTQRNYILVDVNINKN